jgi:predicted O-methyltransferase YrrM
MKTIAAVPAIRSTNQPAVFEVDDTGQFPALVARRHDGGAVRLSGRRPHEETDRWLTSILGDSDPPVLVVIGLGLGYVLDALERRGSNATVIAIEPFAETLAYFDARRDWSAWIETGRLHVVTGPHYGEGPQAWRQIAPADVPPVLVNPALAMHFSSTVAACRIAWMRARFGTPLDPHVPVVKQSMLHPVVLTTLEHLASTVDGPIVEIGAYVGGATIAMARGVRDSGRSTPIVTIEPGGAHLTHPDLPSTDIFGDLQRNLQARGLERFVTLHRGLSSDAESMQLVRATLAAQGRGIGMLCIDADGNVQRDFDLYLPLCASGCLLSVDDYVSTDAHTKADATQAAVRQLMADGKAQQLGVYGYGTWMGIYRP